MPSRCTGAGRPSPDILGIKSNKEGKSGLSNLPGPASLSNDPRLR